MKYPRGNTMLKDNAPTAGEMRVMQALSFYCRHTTPYTLTQVAKMAGVQRASLNELLNRLQAKEMVARVKPGHFEVLPAGARWLA